MKTPFGTQTDAAKGGDSTSPTENRQRFLARTQLSNELMQSVYPLSSLSLGARQKVLNGLQFPVHLCICPLGNGRSYHTHHTCTYSWRQVIDHARRHRAHR